MELMNEIEVGVPVDQTWAVLTDLRRLTPCVPGARLHDVDGEELRGVLDVRVGPIDAHYEGRSAFVELDEEKHQIVLSISGHDTHGQGDATASITLDLEARGAATLVIVVADLAVSGKVAQFGRGVLADVSSDLLQQFVDNLEAEVSGAPRSPSATRSATPAPPTAAGSGSTAGGSLMATAAAIRGSSAPGARAPTSVRPAPDDDPGHHDQRSPRVAVAIATVMAALAVGYIWRRRARRRAG